MRFRNHRFLQALRAMIPAPVTANSTERLRACAGALLGILLTGLITHAVLGKASELPLLIAPMGASAVLLFGVPSSPLAQPWSIIGGNLVAALIGVSSWKVFHDPLMSGAFAVSIAIGAMFALRCLHPPSGAVALTAVLGGPAVHALGFGFALAPVLLNSAALLAVALAFNNLSGRPYPHRHSPTKGADAPPERLGFVAADLDAVLREYNQVLDIDRDDLQSMFQQAEAHAYRRRMGEITIGDIMTRNVISAEFGTELQDAWSLMRQHRIKALPVVDRARRVTGIVTQVDFMKQLDLDVFPSFDKRLKALIRRTASMTSDKPEVVGQLMSSPVQTAHPEMHLVTLVPLLSGGGHSHIPVVDDERRLVGIVTQSDMVAALYQGRLAEPPAREA